MSWQSLSLPSKCSVPLAPPIPYYYKVRTGILSRGGGLYHGDVDIVGVENNKLVGGGLESNSTEEDHLAVERERWLNI